MLTTEEAAKALRKAVCTLQRYAQTGKGPIQPVKIGTRCDLLWRESDIIALLSGENPQPPSAS